MLIWLDLGFILVNMKQLIFSELKEDFKFFHLSIW